MGWTGGFFSFYLSIKKNVFGDYVSLGRDWWDKPVCPQGCSKAGSRWLHIYRAHVVCPSCYSLVRMKPTILPWAPGPWAWPCGDYRQHVRCCTYTGVLCDLLWRSNQPIWEVKGLCLVIFDQVVNMVVWSGRSERFTEGSPGPREDRACIEEVFGWMKKENRVTHGLKKK